MSMNVTSLVNNTLLAKTATQPANTAQALAQSVPVSTAQAATNVAYNSASYTQQNPFVLNPTAKWVPFSMSKRPGFISYKGNVYKFEGTEGSNQIKYYAVNASKLPYGERRVRICFNGQQQQVITGYNTTQKQVGEKQVQIGTEQVQVQVGTEQVKVGTESDKLPASQPVPEGWTVTGTEQVKTGTENVKVGEQTDKIPASQPVPEGWTVTGTEQVKTGTEQVKVGTEVIGKDTKEIKQGDAIPEGYTVTGTKQVQIGTRPVVTGERIVGYDTKEIKQGDTIPEGYTVKETKQVQVGTERVQTGETTTGYNTRQIKSGTPIPNGWELVPGSQTQVQVGTKDTQVARQVTETVMEKVITQETYTEQVQGSIKVSREVDGKNTTGAVGDMLTRGTQQLSDANNFFNNPAFSQYQVSSLTGENNQVTSSQANLIESANNPVLGADDMYVAGDPLVGGKGNNYTPVTVTPQTGYMTMLEDGLDDGRKITINSRAEVINAKGNKAFTEYGFVVQDDQGAKTNAVLSGGKLTITNPQGQKTVLLPGQEYLIGSATDPVARFHYASMPGGENGANETRLVFDSFEKPTQATIDAMVAKGANPTDAAKLRTQTQATFGFRVPDGKGSYRMSAGVGSGSPMNVTGNSVKTYYDAHFSEGPPATLNTCETVTKTRDVEKLVPKEITKTVYDTVQEPVYECRETIRQPIKEPVFEDKPVYETRQVIEKPIKEPVCGEEPVYETRQTIEKPITKDVFETRDVCVTYNNIKKDIYECRDTFDTYNLIQRDKFEERPKYETQSKPIYKTVPIYEECKTPIYGKEYGITSKLTSPLVLDLEGDGIQTVANGPLVDIDGDGKMDKVNWVGNREGVLAFDANKNGKIDPTGLELFGDVSDVNGTGKAGSFDNGFEALKAYAAKNLGNAAVADNKLNATEITSLEANAGFRMIVGNQVGKPSELGIKEINLNYMNTNLQDRFGNEFRQQSDFTREVAPGVNRKYNISDLWLQHEPATGGGYPAPAPVPAPAPAPYQPPRPQPQPPVYNQPPLNNPYHPPVVGPIGPGIGHGGMMQPMRAILRNLMRLLGF